MSLKVIGNQRHIFTKKKHRKQQDFVERKVEVVIDVGIIIYSMVYSLGLNNFCFASAKHSASKCCLQDLF